MFVCEKELTRKCWKLGLKPEFADIGRYVTYFHAWKFAMNEMKHLYVGQIGRTRRVVTYLFLHVAMNDL